MNIRTTGIVKPFSFAAASNSLGEEFIHKKLDSLGNIYERLESLGVIDSHNEFYNGASNQIKRSRAAELRMPRQASPTTEQFGLMEDMDSALLPAKEVDSRITYRTPYQWIGITVSPYIKDSSASSIGSIYFVGNERIPVLSKRMLARLEGNEAKKQELSELLLELHSAMSA